MILLAGSRGDASSDRNSEQVWRLLARQHPARGGGEAARVLSDADQAIGATGAGTIATDPDRGLTVAADARLDGRAELRALVGQPAGASDAALILAAWSRWGVDAPLYLYGDYAFAVWNERDRSLVLVRDVLGQRPLFFVRDGSAFASRADAFDVLDGRYAKVCEAALADRLALILSGSASLYDGIDRVLPGEAVAITPGRITRKAWWRPSTRPDRGRGPAESVAECRAILEAAVADRVGDATAAVASHLSAGLDSSVATALAVRLKPDDVPLHAFTAVPAAGARVDGRLADEGDQAALAAASLAGVVHHKVTDQGDPLGWLAAAPGLYQQFLPNPANHGWVAAINDSARAAGASILLLGQTGNFSFSMGGDPNRRAKRVVKALLGRLPRRAPDFPLLTPVARARIGDDQAPAGGAERRLHFLQRFDPGAFYKGFQAHWGLEPRDPFSDRRLLEFSLTMSDRTLAKLGDRGLGRPVAAFYLPASFVNNRTRGYQAADWIDRLQRQAPAVRAFIAHTRDHDVLRRLLDLDAVAAAAAWLETGAAVTSAEVPLYRVHLPRALAAMAFVHALAAPLSRSEPWAWQGARL